MDTNQSPNKTPFEPRPEALDIAARIFANRAKRLHQHRLAQQRLAPEEQKPQVKKVTEVKDKPES